MLHREYNAITVLDGQERQVRKIERKATFGMDIGFGWGIHMDKTTHNIYVPFMGDKRGVLVLCLSVEGEPMCVTPLE